MAMAVWKKMGLSFLAGAVFMAIGNQINEAELLATECPVCTPTTGSAAPVPTPDAPAAAVAAAPEPDVAAATPVPVEAVRSGPAEIAKDVFDPYTKSQYPKTFAKFGARMKDVEKARQAGAFLASHSPKCEAVDMSEISMLDSTREKLHVFVDCRANNADKSERFRFDEVDLKDKNGRFYTAKTAAAASGAAPISDQSFSKDTALASCKDYVTKNAQFPSSVDFSWQNQKLATSKGNGETWVELDFEAKNGLGNDLPYRAFCNFPIKGKPVYRIEKR